MKAPNYIVSCPSLDISEEFDEWLDAREKKEDLESKAGKEEVAVFQHTRVM